MSFVIFATGPAIDAILTVLVIIAHRRPNTGDSRCLDVPRSQLLLPFPLPSPSSPSLAWLDHQRLIGVLG